MIDDIRLQPLGQFTPEGKLTPGYGDHYLFLVGRDDVHGIMHYLLSGEKLAFECNMYGYADDQLNQDILKMIKTPSISVQLTLDKSQSGGVHEKKLLSMDEAQDATGFANSVAIGESETHQISHTKAGVCVGLGIAYEGSTNWSVAGEGTGISLKANVKQPKGWKAQNNTLVVTVNPNFINRLRTQLGIEHRIALSQQK